MKQCTKCQEIKVYTAFSKDKYKRDGLRPSCKDCDKVHNQQYYKKNHEHLKKERRKYRTLNKDKIKKYLQLNKNLSCDYSAKRRARIRAQSPKLSIGEKQLIQALYFARQVFSNTFKEQYHVDHIIPIAKGGMHTLENLQLLPAVDNLLKAAKI